MSKNYSKEVVALKSSARLEPQYRGSQHSQLDCRCFLLGDRYRQLTLAYAEAVHRLTQSRDLRSTAAEMLESAEIRGFYDVCVIDDRVRLVLHDTAFKEQYPLGPNDFTLRITVGSRTSTMPLPLERFRALGMLLPLLAGNYDDEEIIARLNEFLEPEEREWSQGLFAKLDELGSLNRRKMRPNYFRHSPPRSRVTLIGHTSILVQTATAAILTDPLLRMELDTPAAAFDVTRLNLSAICCTHAHWDHCDVETLLRFDKRTPIIVPRVHEATAFNPPIAPVLRRLGFQDIRELEPWDSLRLGDVEMVLVPFHGEQDEADAIIDHYTYIYRTPDWTLYGGVDSYRDTFGDMDAVLDRIRKEYRPSVAFLPISRMIYHYKYGGVNRFCRYIDTALLNADFQYTAGPAEAARWVQLLGVSTVIPYATFTFSPFPYIGFSPKWPVRWGSRPEVHEFAAALNLRGLGHTLLALRPLDAFDISDLSGSRAAWRRRLLHISHGAAGYASKLNKRLYYVRRLLSSANPNTETHHH